MPHKLRHCPMLLSGGHDDKVGGVKWERRLAKATYLPATTFPPTPGDRLGSWSYSLIPTVLDALLVGKKHRTIAIPLPPSCLFYCCNNKLLLRQTRRISSRRGHQSKRVFPTSHVPSFFGVLLKV